VIRRSVKRKAATSAVLLLLCGIGCRNSPYENFAFGQPVVLREEGPLASENLADAQSILDDSRKEVDIARLRVEWLVAEKNLAEAQLIAAETKERQDGLAVKYSRFLELEARVPHEIEPVAPEVMSVWEDKLRQYAAQTARSEARVRLSLRRVKPLRQKATVAGLLADRPQTVSQEESEP
tara:strand:- start:74 stop:613 length:540 start_codon:yes stop_codon:yes gene_type:complete